MNEQEHERAIGELYAVPLAEFTARRNDLAKQLRGDGHERLAEAVRQLRKPVLTAWAVNQLAHRDPKGIATLVAASDKLRGAHAAGGGALREATKARNSVLAGLIDEAAEVLEESGHTPGRAQLDKIGATLQAASAAEEHRDDLVRGRLTTDLQPSGFEDLSGWEAPATAGSVARLEPAEVRAARREAEDLAARAESAAERAEALRESADRARRRAEEAEEAADAAEKDARSAHARAGEAATRLRKLTDDH